MPVASALLQRDESIVQGSAEEGCIDQRMRMRTESNAASLMIWDYFSLNVTRQRSSLGASSGFPRLIPRPRCRLCSIASTVFQAGMPKRLAHPARHTARDNASAIICSIALCCPATPFLALPAVRAAELIQDNALYSIAAIRSRMDNPLRPASSTMTGPGTANSTGITPRWTRPCAARIATIEACQPVSRCMAVKPVSSS